MNITCAPYSAADTNFAFVNYQACQIYACPGTTVNASGCGDGNGDDSNDQYLSLSDESGSIFAFNDDSCGSRSKLSYVVPSSAACQLYVLHEGCYSSTSCFGHITISGKLLIACLPLPCCHCLCHLSPCGL